MSDSRRGLEKALGLHLRLLDVVRESVVITDADLNKGPHIVFANASFWTMTGYEPGELVGKTPRVLQGPRTKRDTLDRLRRELTAGRSFEGTGINYRKDGSEYHVSWYIEPIFGANNKPEYFVGVQRDVSNWIEQESTLNQMEAALDASASGMMLLDRYGLITHANDTARALLGTGHEELIGQSLEYALMRCAPRSARAAIEEGAPLTLEFEGVARQLAIRCHSGGGAGQVVIISDITERRRIEALANAVSLVNHTGYVFAGIRHELGNPVNSLKTALTVLRGNDETFGPSKRQDYYERMLAEVARIEYLLQALRSYNSLEGEEMGRFDVNTSVRDFMRVARGTASGRAQVSLHALDTELYVRGDRRALYQALLNLVTNALEATAETSGAEVRICTRRSGGHVAIDVCDNGPGMPATTLDAVRRPFFTTKPEGTGLGLPVTQRLLARMDGTLELSSELGQGTTASIFLPQENF